MCRFQYVAIVVLLCAAAMHPLQTKAEKQNEKDKVMNASEYSIDSQLSELLGGEPFCRVGVVLEEDDKKRMEGSLEKGEYLITADGTTKSLSLTEDLPIIIEVLNGEVILKKEGGEEIAHSREFVRIERTDQPAVLQPRSGTLLKGCVTGRGFHWQKEVDFVFPWHLEIHHSNERLVVVNEIPMEPYLTCVVTSEMSKACPPEFIKAQATAARSWMQVFLKTKHHGKPYTICNDDDCQRYQGTTFLSREVAEAVADCAGMYLVNEDGTITPAYYSKSCGGIMEKGTNVFGEHAYALSSRTDAPDGSPTEKFNPVTEETIREWVEGNWVKNSDSYCSPNVVSEETLTTFIGAVDDAGQYYRWQVKYTQNELTGYLREKAGIDDIAEFVDFKPGPRGNSGRLSELTIVYKTPSGEMKEHIIRKEYYIRKALHVKFLFSGAFVWDYEKDADGKVTGITLTGAGWGHGAGLCQIGALGMAMKGKNYVEILKAYYDGAELKRAY